MVGNNLHLGCSQRTYQFIAELKEQCRLPSCQISFVSSDLGLQVHVTMLPDLPWLCSVVHTGQCFLLAVALHGLPKPEQYLQTSPLSTPVFTNCMFRFLSAILLSNPPPPTAASIEFWALYLCCQQVSKCWLFINTVFFHRQ